MGVSFNPDTFTKGGLIQDVDVEIIGGRCTLEPPEGYTQRDRIFVELDLKVLDTDEEVTQHWSAGKNTDFTPSADGDEMVTTGSRSALNDNSNWSLFTSNLVNCQFPKDRLNTGKVSALIGTQIHVVRIPAPEREGLAGAKKDEGRKQTILVPNKLIKLPGEKSKATRGKGKPDSAASAPSEAAAAPADMDVESEALMAVSEIVAEAGKPIPLPMLKAQVLRKHMKTPTSTRDLIVAKAVDKEWLAGQGFVIDNNAVKAS